MPNYAEVYDQLTLTDDFIFAKVMKNKKLCKKLLEIILDVEIEKIEYVEGQKVIDLMKETHGVRLDIYVKDGNNTVYNVEMQTTDTKNLPKRSRYYQGIIDLNLLGTSSSYKNLNKSYIIFICTFDVFGKGRHIYTFENYCSQDKDICLGDESTKVFLNPYSDMNDVDEELSNFLRYLAGEAPADDFTKQLADEVTKAKENKEWRKEFMTLAMKIMEEREDAAQKAAQKASLEMLIILVKEGAITVEKAVEKAEMTEDEFLTAMKESGY